MYICHPEKGYTIFKEFGSLVAHNANGPGNCWDQVISSPTQQPHPMFDVSASRGKGYHMGQIALFGVKNSHNFTWRFQHREIITYADGGFMYQNI